MKTFKEVSKEKKDQGFTINDKGEAVPSEPIHFNPRGKKKAKSKEIKEAIASPGVKKTLSDLPGQIHGDEDKQDAHHAKTSKLLHSKQPKLSNQEKEHVATYSDPESGSYELNHTLLRNHVHKKPQTHGMYSDDLAVHHTMTKLGSNPIGHETHLYSGVNFNPEKAAARSKNGIVHMPAHTSMSHDARIAARFAEDKKEDTKNIRHIIHVHAKATDKGFHIGKHSDASHEHETVLPPNTKLKYSHTTPHYDDEGNRYEVHHFTIHSQE